MSPQELVDIQAEDEGLWFDAETITEAYLQMALRDLHAAIEADVDADADARTQALMGLVNKMYFDEAEPTRDIVQAHMDIKAALEATRLLEEAPDEVQAMNESTKPAGSDDQHVELSGKPVEPTDEFERGRQQGMLQERALWELAAEGQKIEAAPASQEAAAEPIGWLRGPIPGKPEFPPAGSYIIQSRERAERWASIGCKVTPLYAAPQAPQPSQEAKWAARSKGIRDRCEAVELANWCDRMSLDGECGYYWKSQFKRIRDSLRASTQPGEHDGK